MIRREGHDPLHYTISRRGKKLNGVTGIVEQPSVNWNRDLPPAIRGKQIYELSIYFNISCQNNL